MNFFAAQIRVRVDRESVAAGDDVDPHLEEWLMPATAQVRDVVLRMLTEYLPQVAGPVAWQINARLAAVPAEFGYDGGQVLPLAIVFLDSQTEQPPQISSVRGLLGPNSVIEQSIEPATTGEFVFEANYWSGGGLQRVVDY